jgi:hypothetical protein
MTFSRKAIALCSSLLLLNAGCDRSNNVQIDDEEELRQLAEFIANSGTCMIGDIAGPTTEGLSNFTEERRTPPAPNTPGELSITIICATPGVIGDQLTIMLPLLLNSGPELTEYHVYSPVTPPNLDKHEAQHIAWAMIERNTTDPTQYTAVGGSRQNRRIQRKRNQRSILSSTRNRSGPA